MVRLVNFSEGGATRIGVEMSDGGDIADVTKVSPPPDFVSLEQLQSDHLSPLRCRVLPCLPHDRACQCALLVYWHGDMVRAVLVYGVGWREGGGTVCTLPVHGFGSSRCIMCVSSRALGLCSLAVSQVARYKCHLCRAEAHPLGQRLSRRFSSAPLTKPFLRRRRVRVDLGWRPQ